MFASLVSSTPIAAFRSSIEHLSSSLPSPPPPSLSPFLFPIPLSMVSRFVKNDRDTRQTSPPFFPSTPSLPLLCLLTFPIKVQIERVGGKEEEEGRKKKEGRKENKGNLAGKHEVEVEKEGEGGGTLRRAISCSFLPSLAPPLHEIAHALLFLDG